MIAAWDGAVILEYGDHEYQRAWSRLIDAGYGPGFYMYMHSECIVLGLNLEDQELIDKFGALAYHNIKAFRATVYSGREEYSPATPLEEVFERKLYQAVYENLQDRNLI